MRVPFFSQHTGAKNQIIFISTKFIATVICCQNTAILVTTKKNVRAIFEIRLQQVECLDER